MYIYQQMVHSSGYNGCSMEERRLLPLVSVPNLNIGPLPMPLLRPLSFVSSQLIFAVHRPRLLLSTATMSQSSTSCLIQRTRMLRSIFTFCGIRPLLVVFVYCMFHLATSSLIFSLRSSFCTFSRLRFQSERLFYSHSDFGGCQSVQIRFRLILFLYLYCQFPSRFTFPYCTQTRCIYKRQYIKNP